MDNPNLINGEKPQFGNLSHIKAQKDHEKKMEQQKEARKFAKHVGKPIKTYSNVDITYNGFVKFTCLECQKPVYESFDEVEESDTHEFKCGGCGCPYAFDPEYESLEVDI